MRKLIYGVGINDADYPTQSCKIIGHVDGKQKRKLLWACPFYRRWTSMLGRCYCKKFLQNSPTYQNCFVCNEWLTFSKFKAWMETQDWEGKELDKDLLSGECKVYSPETCVFVPRNVNMFMIESLSSRGECPLQQT